MTTKKKLKYWTIVAHGLIIIGAGHGVIFFFLLEILFFPYVTNNNFSFVFNIDGNHFPVVGLTTFLGQAALVYSIFHRKQRVKNIFQILGLYLLWVSIVYFTYDTTRDTYIHIVLITAVPFAICTVVTFLRKPIKKLYSHTID
jgi:hypothetical protein